jgi:hypothetical protein
MEAAALVTPTRSATSFKVMDDRAGSVFDMLFLDLSGRWGRQSLVEREHEAASGLRVQERAVGLGHPLLTANTAATHEVPALP